MIKKLLLFFVFGLVAFSSNAQKVFSVDYESRADVKVFVAEYESRADVSVYFVKYESRAGWKNKEKVHFFY